MQVTSIRDVQLSFLGTVAWDVFLCRPTSPRSARGLRSRTLGAGGGGRLVRQPCARRHSAAMRHLCPLRLSRLSSAWTLEPLRGAGCRDPAHEYARALGRVVFTLIRGSILYATRKYGLPAPGVYAVPRTSVYSQLWYSLRGMCDLSLNTEHCVLVTLFYNAPSTHARSLALPHLT